MAGYISEQALVQPNFHSFTLYKKKYLSRLSYSTRSYKNILLVLVHYRYTSDHEHVLLLPFPTLSLLLPFPTLSLLLLSYPQQFTNCWSSAHCSCADFVHHPSRFCVHGVRSRQ